MSHPEENEQALPFAETLEILSSLLPPHLRQPRFGIVCGSGLSTLASSMKDVVEVPYSKLRGFGKSTVVGHKSSLAFGLIGKGDGVPVVAMLGRFHPYEGHSMSSVVYPIRVLARLGVKNIIITNAAGSLNPDFKPGTIVVIQDHLAIPNLAGPLNPLLGPQISPKYRRFLPLSNAYSVPLRKLAFRSIYSLGLPEDTLQEGVYAWVSGPTYETPAEGRFLRAAGADVVGMSTIPEVVAAREEGMEVIVLSLVTNLVVIPEYRSIKEEVRIEVETGKPPEVKPVAIVSHEEVLAVAASKTEVMKAIVSTIIEDGAASL